MSMKINFKTNPKVVYLDTGRIPSHDEVTEWWEANHEGEPVPAEDSTEWWGVVTDIRDQEFDDLRCNFTSLGVCLVSGTCGTWRGPMPGGRVMPVNSLGDLLRCVSNCDSTEVYIDSEGLHVVGHHHDGTDCFMVRPLTKKGQAYWDKHPDQSQEVHDHLRDVRGYVRKVREYLY